MLGQGFAGTKRKRPMRSIARARVDALEPRRLMADVTVLIHGTAGNDVINVYNEAASEPLSVDVNGVTQSSGIDSTDRVSVIYDGQGGNDTISFSGAGGVNFQFSQDLSVYGGVH